MRPAEVELHNQIKKKLDSYKKKRALPGINTSQKEDCFIRQIIDSIRRVKYARLIASKDIDEICTNPSNIAFDPLKAAVWHKNQGNLNEAFWLVFLATHFGRNKNTKWNLVRDVYSGLSNDVVWDWQNICNNIISFKSWLNLNEAQLKSRGKVGNHRKYQSLKAYSNTGTGTTFESYINWIGPSNNHQDFIDNIPENIKNNPKAFFNYLYNSMNLVIGFGRMAKFDFLTMVGKLDLLNIIPDSTYMVGATGPVTGARILFGQNATNKTLEEWLNELDEALELDFGMQVLEDAICNWQKNTSTYVHFSG